MIIIIIIIIMEMSRVIFFSYIYRAIDKLYFQKSTVLVHFFKTYAAISNAHLSRVCKRGKLSGSCLSILNGFGSTQLLIFLCHIGVPIFSSQNN